MKIPQPTRRRVLYISFLILGVFWIWRSTKPSNLPVDDAIVSVQAGFLAPDFTLENMDGQKISLSSQKGKVVLVNIWASWCPPCRAEMPAIERVYQTYKDQGFVAIGIDSTIQDKISDIQIFLKQTNISFPILLDTNGLATRLYRVQSLPSSYFIGRDGIIREIVIGGPMAEALLISRIEKLLQEEK